jgi:hypothetical protein
MNIETVNERIYIMVVMQLSVSIDCPFNTVTTNFNGEGGNLSL